MLEAIATGTLVLAAAVGGVWEELAEGPRTALARVKEARWRVRSGSTVDRMAAAYESALLGLS